MGDVMTARVAVCAASYAIDKPYTYLVPEALCPHAAPGQRVLVPFGRGNRRAEGLILSLCREGEGEGQKPILSLLDETPLLEPMGIRLALWMREQYFCTVYEAVKAMLPAGLYFSLRDSWRLCPGVDWEAAYQAAGGSAAARRVLDLVAAGGGSAEQRVIREAFGLHMPDGALRQLRAKGILSLDTSVSRGVRDKTEQMVSLAIPPEEAMAQAAAGRSRSPLRYSVVELLCTMGEAAAKEVCYFTGASMAALRAMAKKGLVELSRREVLRRPALPPAPPEDPPVLNREQQAAFDGLAALADGEAPACALLYGVTGSGKTQVYIRLVHHVLAQGKSAAVLVPEIALTPQLLRVFSAQFGRQVAVLHSSLPPGERYDEWKRVRSGEARVVVGTRSAVFAPLVRPGLFILDEEQESSYKSENAPRYHARDIAKFRCAKEGALLLLGSATPAVESMYWAREGVYHLFTIARRYNCGPLPQVTIADMREELRQGRQCAVGTALCRAVGDALARGEQSILFLNRRGSSRMVTCSLCGQVPECPRCSVHLTYHKANGRLMCHHCGHSHPLPRQCPSCGGSLIFQGAGTQLVEEELQRQFPHAEILRMDADTVSARNSHEKILSRFARKGVPILVGTQMVAKGLDFPGVTLVGVVAADMGLYVDDFRAAERTFSLLTQVVGRAGRGSSPGRAVIQTFTPENDVIRHAVAQDYDGFYAQEIALRRCRGLPPFSSVYVITCSGEDEGAVLRACMRMRDSLEQWRRLPEMEGAGAQVLGPAAAPVLKVNNRYRYRLTLSGESGPVLRGMAAQLLLAAHQDKLNRGVSVWADWNPMD